MYAYDVLCIYITVHNKFDGEKHTECRRPFQPTLKHQKRFPVPMGFPVRAVVAVLWTTQLVSLGLVGVTVYQQHLLFEKFRAISEGGGTGGNRGETAKTVAPGGDPSTPETLRLESVALLGAEAVFFNQTWNGHIQAPTSLISCFSGLVVTLILLLAFGKVWAWVTQGQQLLAREPSISPSHRQELARRQLAEVRLRRHGFGQ